jgi:hypothetical protein
MPPLIVPESFALVLAVFVPCFTASTYRTFRYLVAGWVHCPGRRTVTAVVMAAGAVGWRHVSVFHRFFARARWEPDALGHVVFQLALRWVPPDQPLYVLVDDTLARKRGKAIALGSMHHDPLLSSVRKAFSSFGHVWVVLALWVPLPFGPQGRPKGVALPILCRLYVGRQRGNRADARAGGARATSGPRYRGAQAAFPPAARRPTKPEVARAGLAVLAQWAAVAAPGRRLYLVGDTAYTNRTTMEGRPANVEVVGRLRLDAALWTPPPARSPGQRGRPRKRGHRLPTPQALAAARTPRGTWHRLRLVLYGRPVAPLVFRGTALWYGALRDQPVRFVVVRDPSGRRHDEAFFCTDLAVSVAFLLTTYAKRWTLEVTFFDLKQALGFEDPQNQAPRAVRRTAPFAGLVHALVVLWAARQIDNGAVLSTPVRPWYRHKARVGLSFGDLLAALRQAGLAQLAAASPRISSPVCPPQRHPKPRSRPHSIRRILARSGGTRV